MALIMKALRETEQEHRTMLILENSALIIVDIQGKLANLMHEKEALFENLQKLIKGAQIFGIPILVTEQNPERLGPTLPEIACLIPNIQPISKLSFSCCGSDFRGRNRVTLTIWSPRFEVSARRDEGSVPSAAHNRGATLQ